MTIDGLPLIFALVPVLILIEGFFSGSEIALLSADKLSLKAAANGGSRRAKVALELASHPERVLSSTLLVTSLCVIATSSLIAIHFTSLEYEHAELISILVTSPLIVVFGELIPKTVFQKYSNRLALWVAPAVNGIFWTCYPVTRVMSSYTSRLSKLLGPIEEILTGKRRSTRDELRSLMTYGKRESEIKASEKRMIKRILDFKDTEAKHCLIPLVKIEAIEDESKVRDALARFKAHRHSRMPVYSGRVDNIVGVIELSDLASLKDLDLPIRSVITPAHYVAETQALRDLILEMRTDDNELVVVVDEYGGAVGILTFEDIVEEIVGEIDDEYDSTQSVARQVSERSWQVQARTEVNLLNEHLRLDLPEGDYETLGGFLLQQFGRIPAQGDELYFDTPKASLKFTIRKANERAIESVLIERVATDRSDQS